MRLLYLHLENYINIYHGLGRTSLDIDFSSDEKYEKFLSLLKSRSEYQFEVDLNKDDKILTLSTCYKESDRVVLHAKLIKMEVKNGNN